MALVNLSHVTSTLITLLTERIAHWYPNPPLKIVPQSPDKLPSTTQSTLSVYLYHAREDAHYKNAAAPGGSGPIATTPLSLSLYYVITAHHYDEEQEGPDVLIEQALMGYALKTLHDFPVITDNTSVDNVAILHTALRGNDNNLQIIYRPVGPEESATFWNGDDGRLIRFSAFYEVRVVMMEPEPVLQLPGYVLSVGNYVLPTGAIHIHSTHSVVRFTPPGGDELVLPASPARVALETSTPASPAVPNNNLLLRGSRLGGGQLVLRSPLFETPGHQLIVDPALNPLWHIHGTSNQLSARIRDTVNLPGGSAVILPGTYGVSVQVTSPHPAPGDPLKTITTRSNECGVAFTPFVLSHDPVETSAPAVITIATAMPTDLQLAALDGQIEVFVGGLAYALRTGVEDLEVKQFRITDPNKITIATHFGVADIGSYPFRLIIRGAEAPPFWIEVVAP